MVGTSDEAVVAFRLLFVDGVTLFEKDFFLIVSSETRVLNALPGVRRVVKKDKQTQVSRGRTFC